MKIAKYAIWFLMLCAVAACSNKVILDVETVSDEKIEGLKERDIEELTKIRNALKGEKEDVDIKQMVEQNPNYTVHEYLEMFPEALDPSAYEYRVGPFDVLSISVYEEPDLTKSDIQISAKGEISFPLIDRVRVGGLTTHEIEDMIASELVDGGYILNAHVSVTIVGYNSKHYTMLGEGGGGVRPLRARERVMDALATSGVDFEVGEKEALVIRTLNPDTKDETKIVIHLDISEFIEGGVAKSNILLQDRDIIYIPKPEYYYIVGEAVGAGKQAYTEKEITLLEAVIACGGFNPNAATNRIRVLRLEDGVEKIYKVNADAIMRTGKITQDFIIKPGDVIVVPESYF